MPEDGDELDDHQLVARAGRWRHDHRAVEDLVAVAVVRRGKEVLQIERPAADDLHHTSMAHVAGRRRDDVSSGRFSLHEAPTTAGETHHDASIPTAPGPRLKKPPSDTNGPTVPVPSGSTA